MEEPKKKINGLSEGALKTLQKEFVVIGKTRVHSWTAWLIIGLVAGITAGILFVANRSGGFEETAAQQEETFPYKKGVLIVKLKDTVTEPADLSFSEGRRFKETTLDNSDSIDKLNKKFQVRAIRPFLDEDVFSSDKSGKEALKERRAKIKERAERAKTKFSKRTQRSKTDEPLPDFSHVYVLEVSKEMDMEQVADLYMQDPHVEYAQPDYRMTIQFTPNDPFFSSKSSWGQPYDDLWGLKKMELEKAWDIAQGEGVVVAVVDTGIDNMHLDIASNLWVNADEIPNNKKDDDNNGFIDDSAGWNFTVRNGNNKSVDGNGHGTHVSGTIAAIGNNSEGIIGVAPKAKIMSVKGLDDEGSGSSRDLAQAILYAAMNGADVINNSWGCFLKCPRGNLVVVKAIRTAYSLGAVTVFAAGNSIEDVQYYSPQNMIDSKPIVVAASTQNDEPAYFTNFGSLVDVSAPGGGTKDPPPISNILSLLSKKNDFPKPNPLQVGIRYVRLAGTSMAAPHVSGLAALIISNNSSLTNEDVRQIIRASADPLAQVSSEKEKSSKNPQKTMYGTGRINAFRALTTNLSQ